MNQQIALRTIKKLHFSVAAVWNGQEALDYLNEAQSGKRPIPDIILMDVQMPILDGYDATRRIRSSKNANVRNVHVIAMTASAIQGDKEKCEDAGMDDYLPKPVKAKVLEKMLIKWALEGSKKKGDTSTKKMQGADALQDDPQHDPQLPSELLAVLPPKTQTPKDTPKTTEPEKASFYPKDNGSPEQKAHRIQRLSQNGEKQEDHENAPLSPSQADLETVSRRLDRMKYDQATTIARSTETDNDRLLRRVKAEEQASELRDEKLLSAIDNPRETHAPPRRPGLERVGEPSHQLTDENLDKFVREDGRSLSYTKERKDSDHQREKESSSPSSMQTRASPDTPGRAGVPTPRKSRPRMEERDNQQSDETVKDYTDIGATMKPDRSLS